VVVVEAGAVVVVRDEAAEISLVRAL